MNSPLRKFYGHKDENWTRLLTPTETNIHYHKLLFISVGTYSSHKAFKLFLFLLSKYISPLAVQRIFVEALNFCVFYLKKLCGQSYLLWWGYFFQYCKLQCCFLFLHSLSPKKRSFIQDLKNCTGICIKVATPTQNFIVMCGFHLIFIYQIGLSLFT